MKADRDDLVRPATADDGSGILECLAQAFAPFRDQYSEGAYLDTVLTAESLRLRFQEMRILVAQDQSGRVMGTIAYKVNGDEGHVRGMAIRPDYQGTGVAQCLLERVKAELKGAGCQRVTLDTTRPLERAIRFYEKNGFRPTGEKALYFGMELIEYCKNLGVMAAG